MADPTTILPQIHDEEADRQRPAVQERPVPHRMIAAITACVIGIAAIIIGVSMIFLPAGLIVGGAITVGVAVTLVNVSEPEEHR